MITATDGHCSMATVSLDFPTRTNFDEYKNEGHEMSGKASTASDRLHTIEALRNKIKRLGCSQCQTLGKWSKAQIYYHLAATFEGSVDGLPPGYPRVVRLVIRPFRSLVTQRRFPPWMPIPRAIAGELTPPEAADCQAQYERLLRAIDRFTEHEGAFPSHPVLGPLTRSEWIGFHLRHVQHHLAFIQQELSG